MWCKGAVALWRCGAVVRRCGGAVVLKWCGGAVVVRRCGGAEVVRRWCGVGDGVEIWRW